jgi:hypothetical protein
LAVIADLSLLLLTDRSVYLESLMNNPLEIYGYHGTSQTKAESILADGFRLSDNNYDWLGTGIYFFQDAPLRANQWATQQYPEEPAVICARLRLENCIDLFDVGWQPLLKAVYNDFVNEYLSDGQPLPAQNPESSKAHRLDCAFLNYSVKFLAKLGQTAESIRASFVEGERLFPDSAIFDLAHVQVVIKNPKLIQALYLFEI